MLKISGLKRLLRPRARAQGASRSSLPTARWWPSSAPTARASRLPSWRCPGIARASSGRIEYDGADLLGKDPREIVEMGIIQSPEGRRIFGGLSVADNLRMGAVRRKDKRSLKSDMEEVFSLFPVLEKRQRQPGGTLSGGEQQMLAIGRSLLAKPKILMLDEPSLGLGPSRGERDLRVIEDLHARGVTILLVEQNARQALAVADRRLRAPGDRRRSPSQEGRPSCARQPGDRGEST